MALFNRNTKKATPEKKEDTKQVAAEVAHTPTGLAHVLKHARITEKASMQQLGNVYTFDIAEGVSKRDIVAAVFALYKVKPAKVAVVKVPSKLRRSMRTGKVGMKKGGRKAYVYLKKGETITIS